MTIAINGVARQAAHFEDLAFLLAHFLDQEFGWLTAKLNLIFVDHHDLVGIENVIERHNDDIVFVGELDHPVETFRRNGDRDNRVVALVDEVFHRTQLGGNVSTGRNDLQFLDVFLDASLLGESLGSLDHLNAPCVTHKAVDNGNAVRTGLLFPLEILRLVGPWLEASWIGTWARHNLRPGERRSRSDDNRRASQQWHDKF